MKSLQDVIGQTPDLVGYFYNDTLAPHFRARTSLTAQYIPPAFTNWRDEQRAWRESAVLFDQSHHMPELFLTGPDALTLLTRLGINSFAGFTPDRAKQFVACTPRGHVIGDCVLYNLGDDGFELVSGMPVLKPTDGRPASSWAAASTRLTSRTTTSRRGTSATAASSSSTTTSPGARRWPSSPPSRGGPR